MSKVWAGLCFLVGVLVLCYSIFVLGSMVMGRISPDYDGTLPGWAWVVPFLISSFSVLSFLAGWRLWRSDNK